MFNQKESRIVILHDEESLKKVEELEKEILQLKGELDRSKKRADAHFTNECKYSAELFSLRAKEREKECDKGNHTLSLWKRDEYEPSKMICHCKHCSQLFHKTILDID